MAPETKSLIKWLVLVSIITALAGCVQLSLAWAELKANGPAAQPDILAPFEGQKAVQNQADWERRKPLVQAALQREIFGLMPELAATTKLSHKVIAANALDGKASLEEIAFRVEISHRQRATRQGATRLKSADVTMVLLLPKSDRPVPVIMMQTFCPNSATMPFAGVASTASSCAGDGMMSKAMKYVFGRYIATPPLEMIIDHGIGVATIYPPEFVPDRADEGEQALRALQFGPDAKIPTPELATRWGAIAAWGWLYTSMVDILEDDPRLDQSALIAYGHSRYGKAALVGAAFDDRIDGVISHQSGAGGASLNKGKRGETVAKITRSYPHWFAPIYATYADDPTRMSVDQHHLMALIAPRPVFLGNARRDVWSDPNASFEASLGANPVYRLYGSEGLTAKRLDEFNPQADVSFFIRPGTHGVVEEDWPAFLLFLQAHFFDGGKY